MFTPYFVKVVLSVNEAATNRQLHHENSHREEVLDRAALRRRRKEKEEGKVAEDVDCCDSQENEAERRRCRNEDGEVYERRTWSTNTRPEEEEQVLGPVNSFHDSFAVDELIEARTDVDEWSSASNPPQEEEKCARRDKQDRFP